MTLQNTNFDNLIRRSSRNIFSFLIGPWKLRSISLISLLTGYYLASNLSAYYLKIIGDRILAAFILVLLTEFIIRFRSFYINSRIKKYIIIIDNLRLGVVYAIVLEAFKLGS